VANRSTQLAFGGPRTIGTLVQALADRLAAVDDSTAEAREIVASLLDVPRHWPLLRENKWVDDETWARACAAAEKRAAGAPLAYAVGKANFRKLTLEVNERVLIPRPETEILVDHVLEHARPNGVVVDVGTGSGAIAIALATEGRYERVIATDISRDALEVARANAARSGAGNIDFRMGDLLKVTGDSDKGRVCAVASNPPYIAFNEIVELPASVRDWEPMMALLSADNGLAVTARLVRQAAFVLESGGLLALEVDARRASLVEELVSSHGQYQDIVVHLDLAGRERFVLATRVREEK
jgi:release factor glutamine methyltransferase